MSQWLGTLMKRLGQTKLAWRARRISGTTAAVRHPVSLLVHNLVGGTGRQDLHTGQVAHLRYRTRDIDVLREIHGPAEAYRPPEAVVGDLRGR